jgi:hypothetical protein
LFREKTLLYHLKQSQEKHRIEFIPKQSLFHQHEGLKQQRTGLASAETARHDTPLRASAELEHLQNQG